MNWTSRIRRRTTDCRRRRPDFPAREHMQGICRDRL